LSVSRDHEARLRVIIVDDNRDAAEMLAEILDAAGFSTIALLDAQSVLDNLAVFRPDFILIDIGLPVVDGYELAQRVHALEEFKGVRLIAITGYGHESARQRSNAAGFSEHLVKPVDTKQLEAILRRKRE
jgi:PleD family two-component response regulator